jgi:hypothetical protein
MNESADVLHGGYSGQLRNLPTTPQSHAIYLPAWQVLSPDSDAHRTNLTTTRSGPLPRLRTMACGLT